MSVTPRRGYFASWQVNVASVLALLAMLVASVVASSSALASRSPGLPDGHGTRFPQNPRVLAQQRAQLARQLTPAQRKALLAQRAKLPTWKPNARIVTAKGTSHTGRNAVSAHWANVVTTDPNNWTSLGPGPVNVNGTVQTGSVYTVAASASDPNDLWIGSEGGAWHSADGGVTWTPMTDALMNQTGGVPGWVTVDPTNDNVIFLPGTYPAGLYKSTNGGATWQPTADALALDSVNRLVIDPSDDQNMLAAAGDGVWRSTNGGADWTQTLTDPATDGPVDQATDVVFNAANPSVAYAALGFYDTNPGDSGSSAGGVYKSTNGGATWSPLTGGPTGANVGWAHLALSPDGARLYVSAPDAAASNLFNTSLYVFNTSASTWATHNLSSTVIGADIGNWNVNNALAVAPADGTDQTVYLGNTSLYRSIDGGATWSTISNNTVGSPINALVFPNPASNDLVLATMQGVWGYASGTGVWSSDNATLAIGGYSYGLTYSDQGSDSPLMTYYNSGGNFSSEVQYPAGSTGPATWTPLTDPVLSEGSPLLDWSNNANVYVPVAICPVDDCSTGTSTTIYKSTHGGAGPFPSTGFSTNDWTYYAQLTISQVHPQTLFYGTTRVWATTNGGTTWNTISPQLDTSPRFGGTCTGPSDSGCPIIAQVAVAPSDDNEILVEYDDGQTFITTNGGGSWSALPAVCSGCTNGGFGFQFAISPENPQVIYVAGDYIPSGSGGAISHSGICFGDPGIFVSVTGGHSWAPVPGNATTTMALACELVSFLISPTNPNMLVEADAGDLAISFDGGLDWQNIGGVPISFTGQQIYFSHDGSQLLIATSSRGILAMAMPHLTLSPRAATLTTNPGTSPADQIVTLGNSGQGALSWSTSGLPAWLHVSPSSGSIPAGGSTNITLSFTTTSMTPQTYATQLDFHTNADDPLTKLPVTVSSSLAKTWYFAEGYTGGSFTEYLTLANPNPTTANVSVQYLLQGQSPLTKNYTVSANARKTINVNTELGQGIGVSMVVSSDVPIVAERPMYFTFTGAGLNVPGGTDVLGATSLGTQFDFGYLDTTANHATYLTVLNPSGSSMDVTVNYYAAAGGAPTTVLHSVPANSRGTILVNSDVPSGSYSALVTLSTNGLVERPMYLTDATTGYTGSADVIGVQQPTTSWSFAEGYTSATFSERYILSNPTSSATTAHATVTFFKSDGSTANANVTLAPGQQQVVSANSVLGSGVNNSATVTSDQPILAERFMSFRYTGPVGVSGSGNIPGATDVLGAPTIGTVYAFAEGYTGGSFGEYLTLENPQSTTTQVTVVYLPQNGGAPTIQTYFVAAHSRYTVLTNRVMVNQSFSMLVLADQPIVAERPMYFNYNAGQTGGSDVLGYQP
jgi:hypothetical protein